MFKCYTTNMYVTTNGEFTLTNGAVGKVVHLHGDGEILQVVKKLEEGPELLKGDSLQRDNKTMTLFLKHKAWEIMKCHLKQTAACVNTAEDSATAPNVSFILGGIL